MTFFHWPHRPACCSAIGTVALCLLSRSALAADEAAAATGYGLRLERLNALVFTLVFAGVILRYIRRAIRGEKFYMRPLPGLDAVDEAVGRATEMGRPIIFVPGTDDLDNIQTIAGLAVLGRVARTAARYRTPLRVPVLYPLALAGAQQTVQQARLDEGVMEPMDAETVQYVAGESFSFSARIGGMMLREKPAAGIYMGRFAAESLLIAEMGQVAGAIQIAGTAEPEQLPFFIAACDYTLMGEEFYAASAYLANEPRMLGALSGQDVLKLVIVAVVVAGAVSVSFGWGADFWQALLAAK
jgi:hypothetical protein